MRKRPKTLQSVVKAPVTSGQMPATAGPWKPSHKATIGPNGVVSEWLFVTAAMSDTALAVNHEKNRTCRDFFVQRLGEIMDAGDWQVTHQGVAFGRDGKLYDAQHRLGAISLSGKPQWMLVTWNLDPAAMLAVDTGMKRWYHDLIGMAGCETNRDQTSIMRRMFSRYRTTEDKTAADIMRGLEAYAGGLDYAAAATICEGFKLGTQVRAAIATAWYHVKDQSFLTAFCRLLCRAKEEAGDTECLKTSARVLRERLLSKGLSPAAQFKLTLVTIRECEGGKAVKRPTYILKMDNAELQNYWELPPAAEAVKRGFQGLP